MTTPRKIIQIALTDADSITIAALADDGTVWTIDPFSAVPVWTQIHELPPIVHDGTEPF